jgi:hypothetical protein
MAPAGSPRWQPVGAGRKDLSMARLCTVCSHDERTAIDAALTRGNTPLAALSRTFDVSEDALARHRANHVRADLVKAQEDRELTHAETLLAELARLRESALGMIARAESSGDERTLALALREARACLELQGKLVGVLTPGGNVAVGVQVNEPIEIVVRRIEKPLPAPGREP